MTRRVLGGALRTWLLLLVGMFAAGALRVLLFAPRLPPLGTEAVGALLGAAVILGLTRPFVRSLDRPSAGTLAALAALWLALTVAFELGFFHYVGGHSWASLLEQYDVSRGHLWPLVLATLAAAPFVWARRR